MAQKETEPVKATERVGYGCPPTDHQFPNNPKRQVGRKKGSKNKPKFPPDLTESEAVALEEAKRMIGTTQGPLDAIRAVTRAQIKTAMQGGTNAQKAVLARADAIQRRQKEAEDAHLATWEQYVQMGEELIDRSTPEQRIELDQRLLPHPHDVEVDFEKRTVRIYGPANSFERREWNALKVDLAEMRSKTLQLGIELEANPFDQDKQYLYFFHGDLYETTCEKLPERHRPEPIEGWFKTKAIKLLFDRAIRRSKAEVRRSKEQLIQEAQYEPA